MEVFIAALQASQIIPTLHHHLTQVTKKAIKEVAIEVHPSHPMRDQITSLQHIITIYAMAF